MARKRQLRVALVTGLSGLVAAAATMVALQSAHAEPVRYEAEDADCDGAIENEHSGFTGNGYCNTENTSGAAAVFTIDAPDSGTATVDIRYANGGGADRTASITAGGASVTADFAPTGSWTSWSVATVALPVDAGSGTIAITAATGDGLANLDHLDLDVDSGHDTETTRYEAEDAPATCDGSIESEHSGYSGSGFCDTENTSGTAATFTVGADAAGSATLTIGFANGASGVRGADVVVNGSTAEAIDFPSTGAWNAWQTETVTVDLNEGANTVALVATGSSGLPNVDYLDSTAGDPPDQTTPPDDETTPPTGDALYVAPGGSDGASGSESDPTSLPSAIDRIEAGGTIYMRGGTYHLSETVHIEPGNDGLSSDRTEIFAYPGETPVVNFSAMAEDSSNRGIAIGGDWWHIRGVIVEHAGDNGILLGGDHNIIERVVTRFNHDTGLQLSRYTAGAPSSEWPSNNLILSSESHDNADSDGEDADGFAPKLTVGEGNVFRYCVAHNNIDDGWDLYTKTDTGPIGEVTIEDSLSYENGTLSDGTQNSSGDRNGFKLGGEDIGVDHTVVRTIAVDNGKHGFTYNRNLGSMTIENNLSIGSAERNYNFDGGSSVFRNNTSCDSGSNDRIIGDDAGGNQWWSGSNGSRCSQYTGSLDWHFGSDGSLVVTFGGDPVNL